MLIFFFDGIYMFLLLIQHNISNENGFESEKTPLSVFIYFNKCGTIILDIA